MTYYEARKTINKLKDKAADEQDREALRIAADVLLDRYDAYAPEYDGNEFKCPRCGSVVFPDDAFCCQCAAPLDFERRTKK